MVNPLLNLSQFSASKEAQYLSKEKKIPREEFYPYIELIRSSEVDPFAPAAGSSPTAVAALKRASMGQTDMQTAYSLAISNLIQQVQLSRKEALQATATLTEIHNKYKREERSTFLIMLSTVALLSFVMLNTNAWSDVKEYIGTLRGDWKGYDWEWLGNPPSYRSALQPTVTKSLNTEATRPVLTTPNGTPICPPKRETVNPSRRESLQQRTSPTVASPGWSFSRLFWASSDSQEA